MSKVDVGDPAAEREEFESLNRFQRAMWDKLKVNRHKGGWKGADPDLLARRVQNELLELNEALESVAASKDLPWFSEEIDKAQRECADIANFAMMVFDALEEMRKR